MNIFEFFIAVIFVLTVGKALQARMRYQAERLNAQQAVPDGTATEIRQLKERIAVLERVITDNHNSLDLDREIERLRDR